MSHRQSQVSTTDSPLAPAAHIAAAPAFNAAAPPGAAPVEPAFSSPAAPFTDSGADCVPAPDGTEGAAEESAFDRRRISALPISGVEQRKSAVDRRASIDRRVVDVGSPTGLERRRGPGRRRSDDRRSAEEGEMTDEQFEFVLAVDTYKRLNNRPFPTWTEVLEVVKQLGYRKVAQSTLVLPNSRSATTPPSASKALFTPNSTSSGPPSEFFPG